ncbi:hypothetical protein [Planobispora takensis]|uniref:Uncharacterized protein n=1 Tax=Planobispora takensis TaxID=1367882 RepID=A0A8J3WRD4_9ACTN|nr:hypothetical protein [Planobispora takensis]GIH99589.1 hypothetical protein Pta02_15980 [Planobispora takensis]
MPRDVRRLLIVHHTASPALRELFETVRRGAATDEVEGVEVVTRAALRATAVDVFEADGVILGAPGKDDLAACRELGATLAATVGSG